MIRTMMQAFRRLGASVHKLFQVVSEEVPGTLSSLKLSAREINELAQQLAKLRLAIHFTFLALLLNSPRFHPRIPLACLCTLVVNRILHF